MNPFDAVISAGASFSVLDMDYPTTKLSACLDTAMFDFCISFSRQRAWSRQVSRHTKAMQSRCNQHRKSPIPTVKTLESYRRTKFRIVCVDAATEFCESRHQQTGSRPDDARFHVQAWTRRTTKQFLQQDSLSMSWRSERDDAKNN